MSKTRLKFLRGWGRYNKGDIAGFEPETVKKLTTGDSPIAKIDGDGKPKAAPKPRPASTAEADALATQAEADLQKREKALEDREADLEKREAEIADREKALEASVTSTATDDNQKAPAKGAPPQQGKTQK